MRRLRPLALCLLVLLSPLSAGCGAGGRDAHDVAADFEGTVTPATVERLVRNVDLARAPLELVVGREMNERYGEADQQALESFLRDAVQDLTGDRVRVTQRVVDDTGANTQRLTLTVAVEHAGETRYVPIVLDLLRDGRRVVITRARVLTSGQRRERAPAAE